MSPVGSPVDRGWAPVPSEGAPGLTSTARPGRAQRSERLTWKRIAHLARESELRLGDTVLGELGPSHRPGFHASGECLGEGWDLRMERPWGLRVRASAIQSGTEQTGALFRGWGFSRGRVRVSDVKGDEAYSWRGGFFRLHQNLLIDGRGRCRLRFRPALIHFGRSTAIVEVEAAMWDAPHLPRLLLLGWFLRLHMEVVPIPAFREAP